jgi:hypothetical protein
MGLFAPFRPALVALAVLIASPGLAGAGQPAALPGQPAGGHGPASPILPVLNSVSPNQRWTVVVHPDASFALGRTNGHGSEVGGQLARIPGTILVLDSGEGFVAIDSRDAPGRDDAVVLVDGQGQTWARHDLDQLFGEATVEAFWTPDERTLAWRIDDWVDDEAALVVLIPDRPGQPVAVSLRDGLVENPDPVVFVRRMRATGLWFGERLRALELAAASSPEPDSLIPALRGIVREQDAPLLLRLRAAAILQQHGDSAGRALVLLTARTRGDRDAGPTLQPEELRRLPEPYHPCDRIPAPAADRPYDHRAARSYAIQLLPTFLHAEAGPQLGELLGGDDEQDRFDALQAIACLAAQQSDTTDVLLSRVRQRHERETRRLGAISRLVPLGDSAVPADLRRSALSLDVGRSTDAVEALLMRSPASNPVLAGLLEEGGADDVRIAEHFVLHPDPSMIEALLVAAERYRDLPETAGTVIAALAACLPEGEREVAPSALADPEAWLEWGGAWRRQRRLQFLGQLLVGLLPLAVLVGVTRRKG